MRGHKRMAALGSLVALAAYNNADTIAGNGTNELVAASVTASTEHSAPAAQPGNGRASMFAVPREARDLFLSL